MDFLAITNGTGVSIYVLDAHDQAVQVAALALRDTNPSTVASLLAGLRPFLSAQRTNGVHSARTREVSAPKPRAKRGRYARREGSASTAEVLEWARTRETFTARDLETDLGLTSTEAKNRISVLKTMKGVIERVGTVEGSLSAIYAAVGAHPEPSSEDRQAALQPVPRSLRPDRPGER